MKLKLGLDIGVASVGWGIIDENYHIVDCGVRLFPENSPGGNEIRRTMRSARRRLRRRQYRLQRLEKVLARTLAIEKPVLAGNIYEIRCRGLQEKIAKEELFAAVMHLAKRRGTFFLTAEDFEKKDGEQKSTDSILYEQEAKLKDKFVCQMQYEKLDQDGKVRGIENRFRHKDYCKELKALLVKQGEYYPEIKDAAESILEIYDAKREYFEGPGSRNSPTPYGRFRKDENGDIIEVNLIDLMRGKCTYFPEEKRMAQNAYTACLFNLLNDLNNMTAGGASINYEQKKELVDKYVNEGKNISLSNIAKVTGVKEGELRGYRIDKSEKPVITQFAGYRAILDALKKAGIDNDFIKGNIKLVDEIADILTREKDVEKRYQELISCGIKEAAAQELKKRPGFTKYHSLSKKAMDCILDDLWYTDKNQMQLFSEIGLSAQKKIQLRGINIPFNGKDWIVSPVTKRAVNEAVKVINEVRAFVRKKYKCEFTEIVIEMAREKNSKERKDFINKLQQQNYITAQRIKELTENRKLDGQTFEVLKLLLEQDFKCAYSLKPVSITDVLSGQVEMEIDHIIPRSWSFDDSQANKVAVLAEENRSKDQATPFQYLNSCRLGPNHKSYEEFKSWVLNNTNFNKKKRENLLYEGDPQQDSGGFINRNLVDTRYACKEVLNLLQAYFKENQLDTKVSVIKGSFTHAFRKKARLDKDRETTHAHHAQDALIVAGLSNTQLMQKVNKLLPKNSTSDKESLQLANGKMVDVTTGEVVHESDFDCGQYIRFIKNVEKAQPKYSYKVDRKPNRVLYDANVKATRNKDGKIFIITKYKNIYDKGPGNSGKKLKERIQIKPETLLMYHNDRKTFEIFKQIVEYYPDSKNPFADYYTEYGHPIQKYARKENGPFVMDVKFYEKELGNHRENIKQQSKNTSVYLNIKPYRADFYFDNGMYKFISVPYDMLAQRAGDYYIDMEKYNRAKQKEGINDNANFLFSLHKGEFFSYEKDGKLIEWIYHGLYGANILETKLIDRPSPKQQYTDSFGIRQKLINLTKYHVDVLGNKFSVKQERFSEKINV